MFKGYLSIFATVLLWSGFFLSLKGGAISSFTPADIAITRFLVPALVLFPVTFRARKQILSIPIRYLLGMIVGGGLPYLLIAGWAMQNATVSDGSALVPGTLPLFVSAIAVILFSQPLSEHRKVGLGLIIVGIGLFLWSGASENHPALLKGHLLFLVGSLMWATFTICARVSHLPALVCAGLISFVSFVLLALLIATGVIESSLLSPLKHHSLIEVARDWPFRELLGHLLIQGFGIGLFASFTFLHAISILGAERTAAFGSLTPVVATLLAMVIFNETPQLLSCLGLVCICVGSIIASNVFIRQDASLSYQPPQHSK
ncbi:DMT family transporter [Vibrio genomosp. F10]|uniref:DMT family transporter n=1 Tax=Vibrio genomosp. F10 TaxID=723171 RepID=UPI0002E180B9|nr:DMT family transporter [Vibrio genomosp. F10]